VYAAHEDRRVDPPRLTLMIGRTVARSRRRGRLWSRSGALVGRNTVTRVSDRTPGALITAAQAALTHRASLATRWLAPVDGRPAFWPVAGHVKEAACSSTVEVVLSPAW
jgi:hypothetical protein